MMEPTADMAEPMTPAASVNISLGRFEDSGYHTSITPGSFDHLETYNENVEPIVSKKNRATPINGNFLESSSKPRRHKRYYNILEATPESPIERRGTKRSFHDDSAINLNDSFTSIPTPTSIIAGGIQKLKVKEDEDNHSNEHFDYFKHNVDKLDTYTYALSYPSTPVKKMTKIEVNKSPTGFSDCHKSSPLRAINNLCCPPKRSAKKLNFTDYTFTRNPEAVVLKPMTKVVRNIFRPEQRVDIVKLLFSKVCCMPAINKIFSYLSNEDIYNFSSVSPVWLQVCEEVSKAKCRKEQYITFITNTKENHENRNTCKTSEYTSKLQSNLKSSGSSLRDIHNIVNSRVIKNSPARSPPTTPKTRRFKTFTKSASLDSRIQQSCVRCCHPAKITKEETGEEWVACTNQNCSYQFCRFCMCNRHPNRICAQYDLEGPSPSKRKKKGQTAVGTKKSKKNLRRLLN